MNNDGGETDSADLEDVLLDVEDVEQTIRGHRVSMGLGRPEDADSDDGIDTDALMTRFEALRRPRIRERSVDEADIGNPAQRPRIGSVASPEPAAASQEPAEATSEPARASPGPAEASSEPAETTSDPPRVSPELAEATSDPASASPGPAEASTEPTSTSLLISGFSVSAETSRLVRLQSWGSPEGEDYDTSAMQPASTPLETSAPLQPDPDTSAVQPAVTLNFR